MTKIEMLQSIIERRGVCSGIHCNKCPLNRDHDTLPNCSGDFYRDYAARLSKRYQNARKMLNEIIDAALLGDSND